MSLDLVFVAARRTPFAKFGGSFSALSATDLAVEASKACLAQSGLAPSDIGASVFGNVIQSSPDAIYLARHVALKIGCPLQTPALTVNRLCGSGFEAIVQGAYLIQGQEAECVLVGGSENMTQVPYVLRGARLGYRMGNSEIEDALHTGLIDSYTGLPMAITAENLAEQYSISRSEVDAYALRSQQGAAAAWSKGLFEDEVAPVVITSKKGETRIERDEHIRPDTTIEGLEKLKSLFKKDGTVTAGTASGIVDGASALIITSRAFAEKKGLKILGSLKAWGSSGCDPKVMGIGPVPATHKALKHYERLYGKTIGVKDFRRVEVNEAFGAQYLAVQKELGLDPAKTNVNGGAIAIGHPLAASGARLTSHLLYDLKRLGGGLGLASACIGGGQGMSLVVEVA
ncbi:MAG: acetyl-CoA C-acetyltransferase [Bdellovibrionota bacterium]